MSICYGEYMPISWTLIGVQKQLTYSQSDMASVTKDGKGSAQATAKTTEGGSFHLRPSTTASGENSQYTLSTEAERKAGIGKKKKDETKEGENIPRWWGT